MTEQVILVDKDDQEIGIEEKMKAHQEGKLHRAFSVFVFNSKGELLLQQREKTKYHCAGLWSNTCCSHPRPGETLKEAAQRRLKEEMGIDCQLTKSGQFIYRAGFDNGLIEYEYDHVFVGKFNEEPYPNSEEVDKWKWILVEGLKKDIDEHPEKYTPWLKTALKHYEKLK